MSATASTVLASRLSAARAGSSEALGQALDQCRQYLLQVARQSLGSSLQAKGGASDLVQETFLEAQRQFPRFEGVSAAQLRAWLRCLLLHQAAKLGRRYRRTRKRQLSREVPLSAGGLSAARPSQIIAEGPSPSVQVMVDEQLGCLQGAIDRLPDDYRRVITLRYQDGLSFDEVGQRLGRSADAARMLWVRAIDRLKLELRGDEPLR
jgi:RNA polymerase sigma-70 factor (ECF subfamily)